MKCPHGRNGRLTNTDRAYLLGLDQHHIYQLAELFRQRGGSYPARGTTTGYYYFFYFKVLHSVHSHFKIDYLIWKISFSGLVYSEAWRVTFCFLLHPFRRDILALDQASAHRLDWHLRRCSNRKCVSRPVFHVPVYHASLIVRGVRHPLLAPCIWPSYSTNN